MGCDELKEILNYNPDSGLFYWRHSSGRVSSGDIAGSVDYQGYVRIRYNGKAYRAHRLAWLYMHGELPVGLIDHKDLNKSNNRFSNLRLASKYNNSRNKKVHANNAIGVKGVHWDERRQCYRAAITTDLVKVEKQFNSIDEAIEWLVAMRQEKHGEFARN